MTIRVCHTRKIFEKTFGTTKYEKAYEFPYKPLSVNIKAHTHTHTQTHTHTHTQTHSHTHWSILRQILIV